MIVACTSCRKKLRVNAVKYAGKNLRINCPHCQTPLRVKAPTPIKILVAHGEPDVCRSILEVCHLDVGEILTCSDARRARKLLSRHSINALLLDVALPGAFPFQLIEEIRESGGDLKIVLLPSVYNRTAYKRTPSSLLGEMDAVFCRNVIIYFDKDAKKKVVSTLYKRLKSGGYLFLGHSESLLNVSTDFRLRHFADDMLYQKPELVSMRAGEGE